MQINLLQIGIFKKDFAVAAASIHEFVYDPNSYGSH